MSSSSIGILRKSAIIVCGSTKAILFCNAVPAIGTADKARNQLLITVQYFPIDRELARAAGEIGDGWMRMTVLLQLREENGKLLVEQDDACLGNPNRIETIAEARNLLLRCADASH